MQPYDYQKKAADILVGSSHKMLAADMGTGKTIMVLTALKLLGEPRTVILCPAVAVTNWGREIIRWGNNPDRIEVLSYDKARNSNHRTRLQEKGYEVLVLDEAHYLKNREAKRTLAVYGANGLAKSASRVWLLSGTFAPNNASEYYPHLKSLFSSLLPSGVTSYQRFVEHFCYTKMQPVRIRNRIQYIETIYANKNVPELRKILQQTSIRIKAADVLPELPPLSWGSLVLESKTLRKILSSYTEEVQDYLNQLMSNPYQPFDSHMMKIRRLICEAKVEPVGQWLQDFLESSEDKIVVFAHHVNALESLHQKFKNQSVLLTGSVPSNKRGELVESFQQNPEIRIFFGQLIAANTAITLTAARRVLFLDQSFVPGENLQAASRCHRIGQHHPVIAQVVMIANSVDEKVESILLRKTQMLTELEYANEN
jgi:SWI/SNF-related matrix-associated actin-dependent regulator 1 of chromatin subfamily A